MLLMLVIWLQRQWAGFQMLEYHMLLHINHDCPYTSLPASSLPKIYKNLFTQVYSQVPGNPNAANLSVIGIWKGHDAGFITACVATHHLYSHKSTLAAISICTAKLSAFISIQQFIHPTHSSSMIMDCEVLCKLVSGYNYQFHLYAKLDKQWWRDKQDLLTGKICSCYRGVCTWG